MPRRDYTGNAVATTLTSGITSGDLAIPIAASTGWPTGGANGKFYVTINRGESDEERVLVESRTGLNLTVSAVGDRGVDDTSAQSHASGATIEHTFSAVDADEANAHVFDTTRDDHTQYHNAARHATAHTGSGNLGLIGITQYSVNGNKQTTSSTMADADAANLAVTFTVPTSGKVLVRLSGVALLGLNSTRYAWGLRDGAADIGVPTTVLADDSGPTGDETSSVTASFYITGLTPAAVKTYKWAHAEFGSGTSQINIGNTGVSDAEGPATMEVYAAP